MTDLAIHIIAVCGIIAGVISVFSWIRMDKLEKTVTLYQSLNRTVMSLQETVWRTEQDFDRLVEEKFPELWPEFSIKDPEDRLRYREQTLKLSIAIHGDAGKSMEKLNEVHRNVTEALASIGKEQPSRKEKEEFKIEDYRFGRTNLSRAIASIGKEQPSRRLKEELKPEDYYEELMEPMVLATYPDQIGSVKRGSLDWIREVLYDIRHKVETATGLRKEALERAIEFCEGLLAEPGPAKPQEIDYQHEIRVARRYLFTRRSDTPKLKNWDPSFTQGIIGWGEVMSVLNMAQEGQLVEWIETNYNPQCNPLDKIDTGKEALNV